MSASTAQITNYILPTGDTGNSALYSLIEIEAILTRRHSEMTTNIAARVFLACLLVYTDAYFVYLIYALLYPLIRMANYVIVLRKGMFC